LKTIAFFNVKGGVGKTTSAVNIAYLAAQDQLQTVLWDLDAQSCSSWYLGVDDDSPHKAIRVLKGKTPVGKLRVTTPFEHLEVIPADISLRKAEALLAEEGQSKTLLSKLADHLSERSQLLIFDCAPTFSKLSENILTSADLLVVPMLPSPLSLRAFEQLNEFVRSKKQWKNLKLQPIFTMVDRRRSIHNEVIEKAQEQVGEAHPIVIPYASELEKMGTHRAPLHTFAKSGKAAQAYNECWALLKERYDLR